MALNRSQSDPLFSFPSRLTTYGTVAIVDRFTHVCSYRSLESLPSIDPLVH